MRRSPPGQPASAGFQFRRIVPLLYRMIGDVAGWERARTALTGACARARQTGAETVGTSFTTVVLQTGKGRIAADQSYEQAGRTGVSYRLALVDDFGRISSFFTVDYSPLDNQIRRELGQDGSIYTLHYFTPGRHEAVTLLPSAPAYADVIRSAMKYLDNLDHAAHRPLDQVWPMSGVSARADERVNHPRAARGAFRLA